MEGLLVIPENEIGIKLRDITLNKYNMIGKKEHDKIPMMIERHSIGKSFALITSNMPPALKEEIDKLIVQYCNK